MTIGHRRHNWRALLEALCKAVGDLPASETDQATRKAYSEATNALDPDEFTARFMASANLIDRRQGAE